MLLVSHLTKYSEEFGRAVEAVLKERGLSNRGMMIKSEGRIDYGTI